MTVRCNATPPRRIYAPPEHDNAMTKEKPTGGIPKSA